MTTDCAISEPTDAEMAAARKTLVKWQTPEGFAANVKAFESLVKSTILFNKNSAGFLLDAIPIAEFTRHRALQAVRLAEQRERVNDGQFRDSSDQTINIEVTEVMEPGRCRGDEYRCGAPNITHSKFDPCLGKAIAAALADRVRAKAKKVGMSAGAVLALGGQAVGWLQTGIWTSYTLAALFNIPTSYAPTQWVMVDKAVHRVLFDTEAAVVVLLIGLLGFFVGTWLEENAATRPAKPPQPPATK